MDTSTKLYAIPLPTEFKLVLLRYIDNYDDENLIVVMEELMSTIVNNALATSTMMVYNPNYTYNETYYTAIYYLNVLEPSLSKDAAIKMIDNLIYTLELYLIEFDIFDKYLSFIEINPISIIISAEHLDRKPAESETLL